ncbi:histidine kinase OS=Tsukamurella paurometabola (strain ATCC 8368 / DSM / CCUG 35730 / CIP 100753/ JCM 10117 / KCTC 9821 / NBRC 16120 / NCIMB 702349 / NCTC 13040) OX=521096 GN=Tpau_2873 PE=4 SV=1 [Tsukamurella paurometabola]|uniref:histidine kinase n=1 Tax=Tsukamurella paurometabola (strain ATCC 8368 / DSM 20162 / CCUG 35730 / CIP 100753 / JCM 10117 / KCTC 9821 / NBRC 16120 / NCIMB 702349 / NCTC 13040) TaxID=521096 RepID=D5UTI6_TSUPD|nr:histidine kinase [Tsukamurella paurometabola]ADG79471.1 integral membrane sensor signal transduction histidine kinase [Tsukamurella paurometabola DSM 20162]SUP35889.1 Sensor histidine kinase desK [Tsukamurella paurometabola]
MLKTSKIESLGRATVRAGRYLDQQSALHIADPDGSLHDTPLGTFLSRRVNWLFLLIALIMWAVAWPTLNEQFTVPAAFLPLFSGLSVLPLAIAWAHPRAAWAIIAGTAAVFPLFFWFTPKNDWQWNWQVSLIIAMLVSTVMVYLRAKPLDAIVVAAASSLLFWINAQDGTGGGWVAGLLVALAVCLLLRLALQSRTRLEEQTEVSELERGRRAILEERTRIARDLHDIVAHRMSLVVVQAQTAQYRVPDVSERARAEFDGIAVSAREALNEVRSLLGVLRLDDASADLAPAPGLGGVDELIDGARAAGVTVEYLPLPDPTAVGESTALVAYRIVQESIANATRHAQGAPITVALTLDAATLNLRIENGPRTSDADLGGPGLGQGIPGMMERARTVGGSLAATPVAGGGFAVRASLPARADAAA